uniref:beta strand repeat-containing protein n=1 Tax=Azotosporobacter soli TaxID=3055040 RepID=UPI0031FE86C2
MQRKWKRKWQRTVRSIVIASLAATVTLSAYGIGFANPTNPNVTAGSADITTNGATMTITTSDKVSINWNKFNIAGGERVNFVQPSVNSVALNRVIGNEASAIYGTLSANGKVFLINPNGILFAPGSSVNVGGLVASTLNLSDSDFLSGQYKFSGNGASVINQGTINAASGGYVALLGAQAKNQGVILANQGSVVLAGGKAVTLDLANDGFLHLAVDQAALSASVSNGGLIQADGGKVLLSARTADALASTVVNNSGIIRGRSIMNKNGLIVLDGGSGGAMNSGTLDASGKDAGQSGGEVKVLGNKVLLAAGSEINVSGDLGGGTALVGGNYQGSGTEQRAIETTVEKGAAIHADAVSNGNGGKVVVWSDGKTTFDGKISARGGAENGSGGSVETSGHDTLNVGDSARVDTSAARGKTGTWLLDPKDFTIAAAGGNMTGAALSANLLTTDMVIQSGNGTTKAGGTDSVYVNDAVTWNSAHSLTFQALKNIYVNAAIANNGTGNLTFTPGASGNLLVGKSGSVHFGGSGNLYIAGNQYTLINNLADWNGMAMSGYFALNNDISGVTGAIGGSGASFTGTVDGLGHKVDIGIVSGYGAYTGLFGQNEGTLRNLGVSGTISGNANRVGGLVGYNKGSILNCYSTVNLNMSSFSDMGGLVGRNYGMAIGTGEIKNSYSTGTLTSNDYGDFAGGLVGNNSHGSIENSYSTGNISAANTEYVGGLAGENSGLVDKSYSTGNASGSTVGGLLGRSSGTVTQSFSSGSATGGTAGGFVGEVQMNFISNSFWNTTTGGANGFGTGSAGGAVGKTNAEMQTASTFAGWDQSIWKFYDGSSSPILRSFLKQTVVITAKNNTMIYNGSLYDDSNGVDYSTPVTLLGTLRYTGSTKNVGTYTITPTGLYSNQEGYDLVFASGTLQITPALLTVTATGIDRGYNGTTNANVSYGGWLAGDNVTISGSAAFVDKNAGNNKTVNVSGMSIAGGSDAGNYTLANSTATTTANIAKASLTATATGVDRGYNGTTNANVTYAGWVAGDNLTLGGTAAFVDKNAGVNKTVNVSGMSITGGSDAGNYTLANSTATTTANISKASLTATATGIDRGYNGTTNANVSYGGWVAGDNLTLSGTAAFADKNAGANKTVNVSGMSITGGSDAGNYTLANSTTTTTANIAKASLTATATGVDRVYNGTTNANVTYDGWLAGDNLTLGGTAAFVDKNAGANKTVNVSGMSITGGSDAGNYT